MNKIKISADNALKILLGVMEQYSFNITSNDEHWNGKSVIEALNIEYKAFRYTPNDACEYIDEIKLNELISLDKAYGIFTLDTPERVFSKENDILTVGADLEIWLQSSKIEMLEDFIEELQINTVGRRMPIQIDENYRRLVLLFSKVEVGEITEITEHGEMAVCSIRVDYIFYPNVASRSDYEVYFTYETDIDGEPIFPEKPFPFKTLAMGNNMTQKSVPFFRNNGNIGNVNLSKVNTFVFTFDGYLNNDFIDWLTNETLKPDTEAPGENNTPIYLKIIRGDKRIDNEMSYVYKCIIKSHDINVPEDTGNETHSLTIVKRWQ